MDGPGKKDIGFTNKDVCFLTRAAGWREDPAGCKINNVGGIYSLVAFGKHSDISCGARCVSCATQHRAQRWSLTKTGKRQMIESEKGFCYLVGGDAFKDDANWCKIENDGDSGYWTLEAQFGGDFLCTAECTQANTTSSSAEYLLHGTKSDHQYMASTTTSICFLTNMGGLYDGSHQCFIEIAGDVWNLWYNGADSHKGRETTCGATCVTAAKSFDQTNGRWERQGSAWDGAVSLAIMEGVQTSETKTITKGFSDSFTVGIEIGCEFEKVSMSTTVAHSTAKSVAKEITKIASKTTTVTCPVDSHSSAPMHTWLYQWVVDGFYKKGATDPDASVFSAVYRCQYTNASEPEMQPRCPNGSCGDDRCTAQHCKPWRANTTNIVHGQHHLLRRV